VVSVPPLRRCRSLVDGLADRGSELVDVSAQILDLAIQVCAHALDLGRARSRRSLRAGNRGTETDVATQVARLTRCLLAQVVEPLVLGQFLAGLACERLNLIEATFGKQALERASVETLVFELGFGDRQRPTVANGGAQGVERAVAR